MCFIIDDVGALERASKVNVDEYIECSKCEAAVPKNKMSKENPSVCDDCHAESNQID